MMAEYRGHLMRLEPGDIIFLRQGEPHKLFSAQKDRGYTKMFVSVTGSRAEQLIQMILGNPVLFSVHGEKFAKILSVFRKLIELLRQKESPTEVSATLFFLLQELGTLHPPEFDHELTEILRYMKVHLAEHLTDEHLARQIKVSKFHLKQLFLKNLQTSPSKYLLNLRMEKAADLLQNTTLSIKEIGCQLGYNSGLTFSWEFKKHFGILPRYFRHHGH